MMDIKPIEYDVDMDRFYIPVNSRYEIQTKGKGSSFRIANTVTHERHLVSCAYVQAMLEDMAKGTHAELMQQQAEITSLRTELEKAKKDGERYQWLRKMAFLNRFGWVFENIKYYKEPTTIDEAIDNAMKGNG